MGRTSPARVSRLLVSFVVERVFMTHSLRLRYHGVRVTRGWLVFAHIELGMDACSRPDKVKDTPGNDLCRLKSFSHCGFQSTRRVSYLSRLLISVTLCCQSNYCKYEGNVCGENWLGLSSASHPVLCCQPCF